MKGRPRRAIVRPWNMLLVVCMFILAVLAHKVNDSIPELPPEVAFRLLLLAGTITLAVFVKELLLRLRMRGWPRADGVVLRSEIVRIDDGESIIYKPLVQCSYQVDGTGYVTEALHPGHENHSSSFESHWRRVVDRYPAGSEVMVTYNPQNPSEGYLRRADTITAIAALIITLALLAIFLLAPMA
jgi:hypothetical protein